MRPPGLCCILFALFLTGPLARAAMDHVIVEAETATVDSPHIAIATGVANASGEACLRLGVTDEGKAEPSADTPAEASLTVSVPWRGGTAIWGRFLAPSDGQDSLWLAVGEGRYRMISLQAGPSWSWQRLASLRVREAGPMVLRIRHRETGVLLDKVLVTTRTSAEPKGMGRLEHVPVVSPYPDPPVTPPAEHPRVFLRRSFLDTLRQRRRHPDLAPAWERLMEAADRPTDGRLPEPRGPDGSNYSINVLRTIDANALLYLLDGDAARGRRALSMIDAFNGTVIFPPRHDVTRDYARTLLTTALVYDWCYDLADEAWRSERVQTILQLASMMEIGYPPTGQSAITSHGGEAQLLRALLAAGIAVYDEFPEIYTVSAGRFFAEYVPARDFFFKAHWHHQGDSYGWYRFRWSLFAAYLFDRMGAGRPFSDDQGQMPYSWIYMRRPDGQLLRDGDTFSRGTYWSYPLVAMMTASMFRDPFIHAEYQRQCLLRPQIRESFWNLLFYDPTIPVRPLDELPLTRYFPEPMGIMVARTGWQMGEWSPTVVAEMKGAGIHFNNHDHLDAGSFQIYYKGALATDAGSYGHYGIPYDYGWNKRSISHNTLLILDPDNPPDPLRHDGGQNFPNNRREPKNLEVLLEKDYRNGKVLAHGFGPNAERPFFSHLKADLTPGYADRARQVERSFVFLNLGGDVPATMVVRDRVAVLRTGLKPTWLLHSVEKPAVDGKVIDVRRSAGAANGRLLATTLLPENPAYEIIGGAGRESEVRGHRFEPDRPTEESQGWRVQVTPAGDGTTTTMLHVLQVMDAEPTPEPLNVTLVREGALLGARIGSRLVCFSETGDPVNTAVALTLAGQEPWDVVITDLAAGPWNVVHDGKILGGNVVLPEAGVLSFRAPPGRVQLRPAPTAAGMQALPKPDVPMPPTSAGIQLVVNGALVPTSASLRRDGDSIWVPVAAAAKTLNYEPEVRAKSLILTRKTDRVTLEAGSHTVSYNDVDASLARSVKHEGGHFWARLDDLRSILQVRTTFDPLSNAAILTAPPRNHAWIANVSASDGEPGREPRASIDGDLRTYWAAEGDGQWIQYDLGSLVDVQAVDIAWLHGEQRTAHFEVQLSADGNAWTTAFKGDSSGDATGFENTSFESQKARCVRIVGHGNSSNRWNSIREVIVRPAHSAP